MKTINLTTAQALIKFLDNQYIEFDGKEQKFIKGIFTIFGHGNVLGLGQALEEDMGKLEVYQGRNEQGMAHAAMGFAKQKLRKQIMACTSSVGPGAANMITAAGCATANNIPVLFLPGDVYASRQPDPVLQQMEQTSDLSISTNDAFRAVSKYWDRISRPDQLMSAMLSAMRVLTDLGDTGAVTIALPQDVQGENYDYPDTFFKKRVHRIERPLPTKPMVEDAVKLIMKSKKPFIVCGGGVRYSEAGEELAKFAKKFNIPFGETQAGKSAVPFDFPLNMGGTGVTGGLAANIIAREADLVIGIGTRFTDFTTGSKEIFSNKKVKFLNINPSAFHAGKLDGVKVIADAKEGMAAISVELTKNKYKSEYTDEYKNAKEKWNKELKRLFNTKYSKGAKVEVPGHFDEKTMEQYSKVLGTKLTQTEVLGELQNLFADDAVVVGSSGSLPGCMQRMWLPKKENTYHMEYGYSAMGYEVCAALGVKIADESREVYTMVGDGSFLMLHSEFITSLQHRKKINVVLFDNAGFGCINNLQMSNGSGSHGTEFRYDNSSKGDIMKIDYAKVAEGYGAKTYKVTTIEELKEAIEDSKKQKNSVLIDIKVLPKTMTNGYEAWWNIGVASVSKSKDVQNAYKDKINHFNKALKY